MMIKRIYDILLSSMILVSFLPFIILIYFFIKFSSSGPAIHWSRRSGKNNKIFYMPKFRTMKEETPSNIASHLLLDSNNHITKFGKILRNTSLDEIPQLLSVIKGDMSLVGPRPALYNQNDLIDLRKNYNIDKLLPGITGWAQINGRDEISIIEKVELEKFYVKNRGFILDMKIIILTIFYIIKKKGIKH